MSTSAIYAGTFDPITYGHLDVVERAAKIYDHLVVAVAESTQKETLFSASERAELVRATTEHVKNVEVHIFEGLLVDYAREQGVHILVRGIRAFSDFEFEFQMALTNRKMAPDLETLFLMPKEDYSYVSSSAVREIASLGGKTEEFAPPVVSQALLEKLRKH